MPFWLKDLVQPPKKVAYLKPLVLLALITTLKNVYRILWNQRTELWTEPLTGRVKVKVIQEYLRLWFIGWSPNYVLSPRSMFIHSKVRVAFFIIYWVWIFSLKFTWINTELVFWSVPAYFQYGFPIYSAKAVRFRMGHPKLPVEMDSEDYYESHAGHEPADRGFVWTYTSPEFPMIQVSCSILSSSSSISY